MSSEDLFGKQRSKYFGHDPVKCDLDITDFAAMLRSTLLWQWLQVQKRLDESSHQVEKRWTSL
jgi:hypothetical protein